MRNPRFSRIATAIISFGFLIYVVMRAFFVGITYDEAWTLQSFVRLDWMHILNLTPTDANNHIVNTLLIKLFFLSGNHSLFIARLPNVLAFVLYLWFTRKICFEFLSGRTALLTFALLLLNPFLLDFFGLARGYGISIAFLAGALWFLLRFLSEKKPVAVFWSLLFAAVAVMSNFSLLNVWISLAAVFLFFLVVNRKKLPVGKVLMAGLIAAVFLFSFAFEPVRKLSTSGSFYYGGNQDFFDDTILSLAKYSFYSPDLHFWMYPVVLTILLFFVLTVAVVIRKNNVLFSPANMLFLVLLLSVLSVIVQHVLLGTLYLIDRTALFYLPLFVLTLAFYVDRLSPRSLFSLGYSLFTLAAGVNFVAHFNFYKTAIWYFDAHTPTVLSTLNEIGERKGHVLRLDYVWPFQSAVSYYSAEFRFIESIHTKDDRTAIQPESDYVLFLAHPLEKVGYEPAGIFIDTGRFRLVQSFPEEYVLLYKRK